MKNNSHHGIWDIQPRNLGIYVDLLGTFRGDPNPLTLYAAIRQRRNVNPQVLRTLHRRIPNLKPSSINPQDHLLDWFTEPYIPNPKPQRSGFEILVWEFLMSRALRGAQKCIQFVTGFIRYIRFRWGINRIERVCAGAYGRSIIKRILLNMPLCILNQKMKCQT